MYKYFTASSRTEAGRRKKTLQIRVGSTTHITNKYIVFTTATSYQCGRRRKEFTVKHFHPAWREKRSFITSRMNSHSNARDSDIPLCTVHDRNIAAGSIIILYTSGRIDRLQTRESSVDLHLSYIYTTKSIFQVHIWVRWMQRKSEGRRDIIDFDNNKCCFFFYFIYCCALLWLMGMIDGYIIIKIIEIIILFVFVMLLVYVCY